MTASVVFLSALLDVDKVAEYGPRALATVIACGGTLLKLGPLLGLRDGAEFTHGAIFSFTDRTAAIACYESSTYRALSDLRSEAIHCSIDIVG